MTSSEIDHGLGELIKVDSLIEINPPESLFHYTGAGGLHAIVNNNGMFAAPYFSMNDPSEMNYGLEIIKEVCHELVKKNVNKIIAEKMLDSDPIQKMKFDPTYPDLSFICFSEAPDNLSEWRSYAEDGNGYKIEINTTFLKQPPDSWMFFKCIYDPQKQKEKISEFINLCNNFYNGPGKNEDVKEIVKSFWGYLWHLVSVLKHPSYCDEKEWRVRVISSFYKFNSYLSGVKLKASALIPFNGNNNVKNLWMGPRNNFRASQFSIESMFKNGDFHKKNNRVGIRKSTVPYR